MGGKRPQVSIGIPVYNGARYLAEALDSLLAQTFPDFELIISDNASTDATNEICSRYAARYSCVRYVRQQENRGAIWNFNHVFELARGDYYRWHAHDDICAPTFLERCVEMLDANPGMALCHTQKARIDQHGRVLGVLVQQARGRADEAGTTENHYEQTLVRGRQARLSHERFRTVLLGPSYCLDCFGLIRSSTLRRTRLILPFFGSEKVLSAELALLGSCGRVPQPLFLSRERGAAGESWQSAEQQQQYVGSADSRRFSLTRLKLLWGHTRAIWHVRLPVVERARCLLAVAQYALQVQKWKRVFREIFCGAPVKSDERLSQSAPPESVTIHQLLQEDCRIR